jgi:ribosomal protein S6
MNSYELTIVVDGKTAVAKKKKVTESLDKLLALFKGKVTESKDWGALELAYKLGKSETGYFMYFEIQLEAGSVKPLNEKLRTDPDILRFLVIRKGESASA